MTCPARHPTRTTAGTARRPGRRSPTARSTCTQRRARARARGDGTRGSTSTTTPTASRPTWCETWGRLAGDFATQHAPSPASTCSTSPASGSTRRQRHHRPRARSTAARSRRSAPASAQRGGFSPHRLLRAERAVVGARQLADARARASPRTSNLVFAPHIYAESLSRQHDRRRLRERRATSRQAYGVTVWGGEWGFWPEHPVDASDKIERYAAAEDALRVRRRVVELEAGLRRPARRARSRAAQPDPISPSLIRYSCPEQVDLGDRPGLRRRALAAGAARRARPDHQADVRRPHRRASTCPGKLTEGRRSAARCGCSSRSGSPTSGSASTGSATLQTPRAGWATSCCVAASRTGSGCGSAEPLESVHDHDPCCPGRDRRRIQGHEAWAIIRRSTRAGDRDTVGLVGGRRSVVESLLDVPLEEGVPEDGHIADRLLAIPFRQVARARLRGARRRHAAGRRRRRDRAGVHRRRGDRRDRRHRRRVRRPRRLRDRRRGVRQARRGDHHRRDRPGRGRQPGDRPALPRDRRRLGRGDRADRLQAAARARARRVLDLRLLHRRPLPDRRQPRAARLDPRRRRPDEPDQRHLPDPARGRRTPARSSTSSTTRRRSTSSSWSSTRSSR